jgi:type IV pilus assembly protein PilN
MTTRINLLPWREELRKEQDRQLLSIAIFAWVLMGLVVLYGHLHMSARIEAQNDRNKFLQKEIAALDKQIAEIKDIKQKRQALVARMNVIYKLQADRTKLVYVMNELVIATPEGVYYNSLVKNGDKIQLKGTAQSNARVSALMRNFEESMWFKNPNLQVINIKGAGGGRLSEFNLSVDQGSGTEADIRHAPHQVLKATGSSQGSPDKPAAPVPPATGKKS